MGQAKAKLKFTAGIITEKLEKASPYLLTKNQLNVPIEAIGRLLKTGSVFRHVGHNQQVYYGLSNGKKADVDKLLNGTLFGPVFEKGG